MKSVKRDWEVHLVADAETGKLSGHTHGLDKWGSLEIEINLHLRPEVLGQYLNFIANHLVTKGLHIEDGEKVDGIFNCPIYFFKVKSVQSKDEVLRVVFPDENMKYSWDLDCSPEYREQIELKGRFKL